MLKRGRNWGAPVFGCEVAGCPSRRASYSDLPPGWGVRELAGTGLDALIGRDSVLCTAHVKAYDKGERFASKGVDERAKFIG